MKPHLPASEFTSMKTFLLLLASFVMVSQSRASPPRPNVVVIMTDDMGFSDIGCYGGGAVIVHLCT